MLFWSGKGIVTVLLLLLGVVVTQVSVELVTGMKPGELDADLHWAPAFLMAAFLNWLFSKRLSKTPKRIVIDRETAEEFELGGSDSLFFIGVPRWTTIYLVISVILWFRVALGWD